MQRTRVAPDGTGLGCPVHPRDAVVVSGNQPHDVVPYHLVLVAVHVVDPRYVQTHAREEGLPPGDGVRSDDGVHRRELEVFVEGRASRRHHLVSPGLACRLEDGLRTGRCECFHVGTEGWRHPVVAVMVSNTPKAQMGRGKGQCRRTARNQNTTAYRHQRGVYLAFAGN